MRIGAGPVSKSAEGAFPHPNTEMRAGNRALTASASPRMPLGGLVVGIEGLPTGWSEALICDTQYTYFPLYPPPMLSAAASRYAWMNPSRSPSRTPSALDVS